MAQFTNQAQLSYNGTVVSSNVAVGEILEVLSAVKTAAVDTYGSGDSVTYILSILNSGATAISGITVSDDLGAYTYNTATLYPLAYTEGSAKLYINGVLQAAPAVSSGPPLVFSGITIPAGGSAVLVYQTDVTEYAPLDTEETIVNTATVSGAGLAAPIIAEETVNTLDKPSLQISKSIDPVPVAENGTITYTFVIRNYGNTAAVSTDNVSLTDIFDPALSDLSVSFEGTPWTTPANYTYDASTGTFVTVPGQILIPAAVFARDAATGAVTVTPGSAVLTVTGTV